jgi:hypothetical protein
MWGKDDFLAVQPWIKNQAFKKSTIRSAYKHCGIWPFDPERVLEKLKDWCIEDESMMLEDDPLISHLFSDPCTLSFRYI